MNDADHIYNVKDFGATGYGIKDDTDAINTAIQNIVVYGSGGTLYFPPGSYYCKNMIRIPAGKQISLVGSGWQPPRGQWLPDDPLSGSWIVFGKKTDGNFSPNYKAYQGVDIQNSGTTISKMAFIQPSNLGTPNFRGDNAGFAAIVSRVDDIAISDVLFLFVPIGIYIANGGRVNISRVSGNPFEIGIHIRRSKDVSRLDNIHFWDFTNDVPYKEQISSTGVGIQLQEVDNPQLSSIFCLGYSRGMHFTWDPNDNGGHTSKFKICNADFDYCSTGVLIDAPNTTGVITNLSCQGPDAPYGLIGIQIFAAGNVNLKGTNIDIYKFGRNGMYFNGSGTKVFLENVSISECNLDGGGTKDIEVYDGVELCLGATVDVADVDIKIYPNGIVKRSVVV